MSIYGLSSRLTPHALPCADADAVARAGGPAAVRHLPWVWVPEESRWMCGQIELEADTVQAALSTNFSAHVATCLKAGSEVQPRPPQRQPKVPPKATSSQAVEAVATTAAAVVAEAEQGAETAKAAGASGASGGASGAGKAVGAAVGAAMGAAAGVAAKAAAAASGGQWIPAQARLTSHYSINGAFLGDEEAILGRIDRIRHIPCVAVQGGNDIICPPSTAYELHEAWPEMELKVVPGAGHSMYDSGLQTQVIEATDRMKRILGS